MAFFFLNRGTVRLVETVAAGCQTLVEVACCRFFVLKNSSSLTARPVYATDFDPLGVYRSGRACAKAWHLFRCKQFRGFGAGVTALL